MPIEPAGPPENVPVATIDALTLMLLVNELDGGGDDVVLGSGAAVACPLAVVQAAGDADPSPLGQVAGAHLGELAEADHVDEIGAVVRATVDGDPHGRDLLAVAGDPGVGVLGEAGDEGDLRFAGTLIAVHRVVAAGSEPQWLPEHRAAAEAIALGRHDRHLRPVIDIDQRAVVGLDLGAGDYDVDVPDLDVFEAIGPHPHLDLGVDNAAHGDLHDGFEGCGCFGGRA